MTWIKFAASPPDLTLANSCLVSARAEPLPRQRMANRIPRSLRRMSGSSSLPEAVNYTVS
jgi:hypothetical protein